MHVTPKILASRLGYIGSCKLLSGNVADVLRSQLVRSISIFLIAKILHFGKQVED